MGTMVIIVCRLKKALYRLKQSSKAWFGRFYKVILKIIKYQQSHGEQTLFTKHSTFRKVMIPITYTDDIVMTKDDLEETE